MIILKVFGNKSKLATTFNKDKKMSRGMVIKDNSATIYNNDVAIYYKMANIDSLMGFRADMVETYCDGAISRDCWEHLKYKVLK